MWKMIMWMLLASWFAQVNTIKAQVADDFEDGDLSVSPAWQGMQGSFVHVNGMLKSLHSVANSQFYISTQSYEGKNFTFSARVKLTFNPSSLNYVDLYIFADSVNPQASSTALFIRLGGSQDEASLYRLQNKVQTKLIDGKDGLLNTSNNDYTFVLLCEKDSFELMHQKAGAGVFISEGKCPSVPLPRGGSCGINIRQSTSSFFGRHFFDDFYFGDVLRDTVPPEVDSLYCHEGKQIKVFFSETIDTMSLSALKTDSKTLPGKMIWDQLGSAFTFYPNSPIKTNFFFELSSDTFRDWSGNTAHLMSKLICPVHEAPDFGDLVISELLPDPSPSVGLPEKEYVEIFNPSSKFVQLSQLQLSDPDKSVRLPDKFIFPDSFCLIFNGPSLNNSGDRLELKDLTGQLIHSMRYDLSSYGDETKSEGGYSLEMIDTKQPCLIEGNYKASENTNGGTPGKVNSVKGNLPSDQQKPEILSFQMGDSGCLTLTVSEPLGMDAWPDLVMELNGSKTPFQLIRVGATMATLFADTFLPGKHLRMDFYGLSDCSGNSMDKRRIEALWPEKSVRYDLMINELLFNPFPKGADFVELYNRSLKCLDLSKLFIANLDEGGRVNTLLPIADRPMYLMPGAFLVLSSDSSIVCSQYICGSQAVFLDRKKMIPMADDKGGVLIMNAEGDVIDSTAYDEHWHFNGLSDRNGVSLERINHDPLKSIPGFWHSAASTSGFATPGRANSQFAMKGVEGKKVLETSTGSFSPNNDGRTDLLQISVNAEENDLLGTLKVYSVEGRLVRILLNNRTLDSQTEIIWDGLSDSSAELPEGIYLIVLTYTGISGKKHQESIAVALLR